MVVKLTIGYLGTRFAGWQRQANALAVQEVIEQALGDLLETPIRIRGASRTDAGVHASGQVAHLRLDRRFPLAGLVHGGNHRLPDDVRLLSAQRMADDFHAQHNALGKCYRYRLWRGPVVPPLAAGRVAHAPQRLDLDAMRQALRALPGRHDFTAFAAAGGSHRQGVRRMFAATLDVDAQVACLRFWGDGFLRGMVRALVGTLLEIGRGARPPDDFHRLFSARSRSEAGPAAPALGLELEQVFYPPAYQPAVW